MSFLLLLVDATGAATTACLTARQFRELPGKEGLSVLFRPVRRDLLFQSAKLAGDLAYRILYAEGWLRSQLWVEWEVSGPHVNVTGRSSELLFALALITSKWEKPEGGYPIIAATGTLAADGTTLNEGNGGSVGGVRHTASKVAAAVRALAHESDSIVFYPKTDEEGVAAWRAQANIPPQIRLQPVETLEDALGILGIQLEKVYLGNPFRGLEHFDYGHRAIFFGRDAEIRAVVKRLVERDKVGLPGLLVEGASGSGKSSFLRAGVLPALVNPSAQSSEVQAVLRSRPVRRSVSLAIWRVGLVAAGADESALVGSIVSCWQNLPEITPAVLTQCQTFEELAAGLSNAWPSTQRFVWMLDQFEELFSLEFDGTLIERLGRFLTDLQAAGVWTLVSMRSDALADLKAHRDLRKAFDSDGQYYLETLTATALDNVITQPASVANLRFEVSESGQRLEHVLREEAYTDRHNALPLLQFTLSELYSRRSGNLLTFSAYKAVGGLAGSVATTAAAILRLNPPEEQASLPKLFRSLVSVDDFGRPARRYTAMAEFAGNSPELRLLLQLVDARLCVTDSREGLAVVAFAHEALLRTWPALIDWLAVEAGLIQMRDLAQRDARIWQEHQESDEWLAAADKLATFESLQASGISLSQSARRFIDRSVWKARRFIRIKRLAIGSIALLAVVASGASWVASQKQHEAEFQVAQTLAMQMRALTQTALDRWKDGDLARARMLILQVLERGPRRGPWEPDSINVFQEIRARDPQVAVLGHSDEVRSVAFSPDSTRVLTGSFDHSVGIWAADTGVSTGVLLGHTDIVMSALYSPDATRIVTASVDGTARIWDAASGKQICVLVGHTGSVRTANYSPNGRSIVTASADSTARLWDSLTCREVRAFQANGGKVNSAVYSPDGSRIVAALQKSRVVVWNAHTGAEVITLNGFSDSVITARYSPDGAKILTASGNSARIWDASTGRCLVEFLGHDQPLAGAAFSPDGATVVTASMDKTARLWDSKTGRLLSILTGHTGIVWEATFSPDGERIATASYDRTARIWNTRVGSNSINLIGHSSDVNDASYSRDGTLVVTASSDNTARIWDANTGALLSVLNGHTGSVNNAVFSPNGQQVMTTSRDATARFWELPSGKPLKALSAYPDALFYGVYSPDGGRVAVSLGDSQRLAIWDSRSGQRLALLVGHNDHVHMIGFSPDGQRIVTASEDNTARVWDSKTGAQLGVISQHKDAVNSVTYSPDGRAIVTASSDTTVRLWDAQTLAERELFSGHSKPVNFAAVSPDGRRLVTVSDDKTIRIWNIFTGEQLGIFLGHTGHITSAVYSPDSRHIVSTSADHTARIWDARIQADLPAQINWQQAAESDLLSEQEKRQLGLVGPDGITGELTHGSYCDRAAAATYDTNRVAPGVGQTSVNPDIAIAACARQIQRGDQSSRIVYEYGRALASHGDWGAAQRQFELAISKGYTVAQVDLGELLLRDAPSRLIAERGIAMLQKAAQEGVSFAAFELGVLYEHGVRGPGPGQRVVIEPDLTKAWTWYQSAVNVNEPNAIARLAMRIEHDSLAVESQAQKNSSLLEAFRLYAESAERARRDHWPDDTWSQWRYRRATLARYLAAQGLMQQVAIAYQHVIAR